MSMNNVLIIKQHTDGKFRGYDLDVDYKNYSLESKTPVFIATSLKTAIDKAEVYCTENRVEYNYRVKFGIDEKIRLVKGNMDGVAFGAEPEYFEEGGV